MTHHGPGDVAILAAQVIALILPPPPGFTHWSSRRLAREVAMSATTILRIWAEAGLKPRRTETFKFTGARSQGPRRGRPDRGPH